MSIKVDKRKFEVLLNSSFLAWLWALFTFLHIAATVIGESKEWYWQVFDKVMILANFLVYSVHGISNLNNEGRSDLGFLPFFAQFVFWWLIGYLFNRGYSLYRGQKSGSSESGAAKSSASKTNAAE